VRFYEFDVRELTTTETLNLDLAIDPKLAWALRNRHVFPVDLNKAPRHLLLRVPGLGTKSVARILKIRRWHKIRLEDLPRLHLSINKVLPFVIMADYNSQALRLDRDDVAAKFVPVNRQLDLFPVEASVVTGQL
jgi:predicted DNA-binding helix-hairpin-helix protein